MLFTTKSTRCPIPWISVLFCLLVSALPAAGELGGQFLFLELERHVEKEYFVESHWEGPGVWVADASGRYRFGKDKLTYRWNEWYSPFRGSLDPDRLVAMVGIKPRQLYPIHAVPEEISIRRGVGWKYVGLSEEESAEQPFSLLSMDESGNAEIEFADQTFSLAVGESREIVTKLLHLTDKEHPDEWYQERYGDTTAILVTIHNTLTNHGFFSKRRFTHQTQPVLDNGRIAYVSNRSGEGRLYLHDLATGHTQQIPTHGIEPWNPTLSGNWLVWFSAQRGNIHAHGLERGHTSHIIQGGKLDPEDVIHHEEWIAYRTERPMPQVSDRYEDLVPPMAYVTLVSLRTGEERQLTDSADYWYPILFRDGELTWLGDERATPGGFAYDPSTGVLRTFALELTETEQKLVREHAQFAPWKRENPWCHVPLDQIGATAGDRVLWWDWRSDKRPLYFDGADRDEWRFIAETVAENQRSGGPQACLEGNTVVWVSEVWGNHRIVVRDLVSGKWSEIPEADESVLAEE